MTPPLTCSHGLFWACFLTGFAPPSSAGTVPPSHNPPPYYGRAYGLNGPDASELLYTERHQESFADGRKTGLYTRFQDPQGRVIAERQLDFTRSAMQPDYAFEDFRGGYLEGAKDSGDRVKVFYRDTWTSAPREKILTVPEPFVIDGGFNAFLKQHWDSLTAGHRLHFNFVAPARLTYYGFVAREEPRLVPEGKAARAFVVEVDNALLRLLVSPIVLLYDASTREMIQYQGISNLSDARGKSLKVRILYPQKGP